MAENKKNWFRQWDEGNFDLTSATAGDLHRNPDQVTEKDDENAYHHIRAVEDLEKKVFSRIYPYMTFVLCAMMILFFFYIVSQMPAFGDPNSPANASEVIRRYIENGMEETGAVNIVAGVILDYRAFDTLGESHVLFTASLVVSLLLLRRHEEDETDDTRHIMEDDTILKVTAKVLTPLIIMFGIYVILAGHLGPGGGFSGGSIIGAALILHSVAYGPERLKKLITPKRYRLVVLCALGFYSFAKCYSFFCGANHLESIFKPGTPGMILSAGLILPLNIAVGVVVALTMYGFYSYFTRRSI